MSRSHQSRPEFRLFLDYPEIRLTTGDGPPMRTIQLDREDVRHRLSELGELLEHSGARLVVVLPETELVRGSFPVSDRRQRRIVLKQAARTLSIRASRLRTATRKAADTVWFAATSRETLEQTKQFLRSAKLKADEITCDGDLHPFGSLPDPHLFFPSIELPARRIALGFAALASATALAVTLPPLLKPADTPETEIATQSTASATPPLPRPLANPGAIGQPPERPASAAEEADKSPVRVVTLEPPLPRLSDPVPLVTFSSRNLPGMQPVAPTQQSQMVRLAELTGSNVATDASPAGSSQRPAQLVALASRAPELSTSPRPRHRPNNRSEADQNRTSSPSKATPPVPKTSGIAPRKRPQGHAVAKPDPAVTKAVTAAVHAEAATAEAATSALAAAAASSPRPAPRKISVTPQRQVAAAKPTTFKKQQATVSRPVSVAPKVAKAAPKPKKTAAKAPSKKQVGLKRNSVSLVGVFGSIQHRRAILRLPNGKMQKVRPGDQVQGTRVAAVGRDSVRLSGKGRDTVLKMAD